MTVGRLTRIGWIGRLDPHAAILSKPGKAGTVMTARKIDQVSADLDDASTTVDELRDTIAPNAETADKLHEIQDALEHASDMLDEVENPDEISKKLSGSAIPR